MSRLAYWCGHYNDGAGECPAGCKPCWACGAPVDGGDREHRPACGECPDTVPVHREGERLRVNPWGALADEPTGECDVCGEPWPCPKANEEVNRG